MQIPITRRLLTERCVLRYPELSDASAMLRALTDHRFPKTLPIASLNTVDAVIHALRERQAAWITGSALSWYVETKVGGNLIGMVRIGRTSPVADGHWNLAFWVTPERWRRGYGVEFSREVVRLAFQELGARVFCAKAPVWNVASCALLHRVGFVEQPASDGPDVIDVQSQPVRSYELSAERWLSINNKLEDGRS